MNLYKEEDGLDNVFIFQVVPALVMGKHKNKSANVTDSKLVLPMYLKCLLWVSWLSQTHISR